VVGADPLPERHGRRHRRALRYGLAFAVVTVLAVSVVLALQYSAESPNVPLMHVEVPHVAVAGVVPGSPEVTLAAFQGRAVVLNFWGSWCTPCRGEMPALQAVHEEMGDRVTFIGIDELDSRSAASAFLRSVGVTYRNGFDKNGAVGQSFDVMGTPTTFFISHGQELEAHLGALTTVALRSYLRQIYGLK
jgi:thiol-disulfide isomerase/thioredoxin